MLRSAFLRLAFSNKKIVSLKPQVIALSDERLQSFKEKSTQIQQAKSQIPSDWEDMKFDDLCALPPSIINALQLEVKKSKFNVSEDQFRIEADNDPFSTLNPYWLSIYQTFHNLKPYEGNLPTYKEENGYLYLYDFLGEQSLHRTIGKFLKNIKNPRQLEAVAEPTLCKYLLSLKRELMLKGIRIEDEETQVPFKMIKILNYQYQFWVDVKHNRAKNGTEKEFIVQSRQIDNPNNTILLSNSKRIKVRYIVRKKKRKQIQQCFCTKMDILVEVEGHQHVVKVEFKGPTSKVKPYVEGEEMEERVYLVIDYDNIYKGNPTIKPTFQF